MVSMWASGITQGLMWQAEAEGGGLLYPSFTETIEAIQPMYWARLIGGIDVPGRVRRCWPGTF